MPAVAITVPGVGESITKGILSRWLKADGSAVKAGEPLFELETDKANNVVPASASGVLKINVAEGETVDIGSTVGTIDPEGQPAAAAPAPSQPAGSKQAPAPPKKAEAAALASPAVASDSNGGAAAALSPAVRRIVAEEKVDPSQVGGTGRGGRITKGDVLAHLATPPGEPAAPPAAATPAPPPNGAALSSGLPRETRKRMSGIRQKIAQRLVEAQQTAAILTTFNEADMSRVMDLRARYKDTFKTKHGVASASCRSSSRRRSRP